MKKKLYKTVRANPAANRVIKFRFWNTSTKQFSGEHFEKDIFYHGFKNDEMIPLQFTGLLDRNGKEIYEGDILKMNFFEFTKDEVVFSGGKFCFKNCPYISIANDVEIVGNIFENEND